ncbi:hypothetical protein NMY22_g16221 [Coprinellus aureogranulatus]|nr:hypothetical protein NMY22_g16221 [Coprinellus aureogranulatus]
MTSLLPLMTSQSWVWAVTMNSNEYLMIKMIAIQYSQLSHFRPTYFITSSDDDDEDISLDDPANLEATQGRIEAASGGGVKDVRRAAAAAAVEAAGWTSEQDFFSSCTAVPPPPPSQPFLFEQAISAVLRVTDFLLWNPEPLQAASFDDEAIQTLGDAFEGLSQAILGSEWAPILSAPIQQSMFDLHRTVLTYVSQRLAPLRPAYHRELIDDCDVMVVSLYVGSDPIYLMNVYSDDQHRGIELIAGRIESLPQMAIMAGDFNCHSSDSATGLGVCSALKSGTHLCVSRRPERQVCH